MEEGMKKRKKDLEGFYFSTLPFMF